MKSLLPSSEWIQTYGIELLGWLFVLLAIICALRLPPAEGAPTGYCAGALILWRFADYARKVM